MLLLSDPGLPTDTQAKLTELQRGVDRAGSYARRVARAKAAFSQRNKKTDPTFQVVRATLAAMCAGPRRCMYCEDSVADEVEHLAPKNLYPERVFDWLNYCYACGPCNGPKGSSWPLFVGRARKPKPFAHPRQRRGRRAPVLKPPPKGMAALLDPRVDDPFDFLALDLVSTFRFTELPKTGTRNFERARYTIELLNLNRDPLPQARKSKFDFFVYALRAAVAAIHDQSELARIRERVRDTDHPTVWAEMKRWHRQRPELDALFKKVPAALSW